MKTKMLKNVESGDYVSEEFHVYIESVKRFYETDDTLLYSIRGWGFDMNTGLAGKVEFDFDGDCTVVSENYRYRPDLCKIFADKNVTGEPEFNIYFRIKKEDEEKTLAVVYRSVDGEKKETVAEYTEVKTRSSFLCHFEDDYEMDENEIALEGWMVHDPEASVEENTDLSFPIAIFDSNGNKVSFTKEEKYRKDVIAQNHISNEDYPYGFILRWKYDENERYTIRMGTKNDHVDEAINIREMRFFKAEESRRYLNLLQMLKNRDAKMREDDKWYLKEHGFAAYRKLVKKRFEPLDPKYQKYFDSHKASKKELERQAKENLDGPVYSIVVPTYNTREDFLRDMIESVRNQSYSKWQLCIADGSEGNKKLEAILEEYHQKDSRIVYTICEKNGRISGNTNAALKLVTGDYIALLDHDDMLAPEALYEVTKVILENEDADVVYTDEDKFTDEVKDHYQPAFKPDFHPDFLRACNYITHLFVVKKEIVDKVGEFDPNCDGSQDYDFILRCTEQAKKVYHIPKILYYWRCHPGSVALNPESKSYAYDAAKRALEGHLKRKGVAFDSVCDIPNTLGIYRVNYTLTKKKVSVILLGKEVKTTETSIKEKTSYGDYEIIGATSSDVTSGEKLSKRLNEAVAQATGEYVLFLDSNMDVLTPDFMEKLLATCERSDVGVAGGKIFYEDDTVYQVGVVMGYHDLCGRLLAGRHHIEMGQYANAVLQQNTSAVLASCMMVEKKLFEELGGFDEHFTGAFFDVDFCLRAREKGLLISFEPEAQFVIHKDKYPGCDIVDEKYVGYDADVKYAKEKWSDVLKKRDPNYNPNLSLKRLSYDTKYDA